MKKYETIVVNEKDIRKAVATYGALEIKRDFKNTAVSLRADRTLRGRLQVSPRSGEPGNLTGGTYSRRLLPVRKRRYAG